MMLADAAGNAALVSFCIYILGVFLLAWLASRKRESKSFMNEYFLGSRNLGLWAFALTYAATSASGGSFMGFPAKIYTYGWVMALWIGGYIVVPLVAIGLISKRLNQVARKSGSITVPEMMRKRLGSPTVGQVATVLLVFFQFFFLLAQFKAGAKIMTTLLGDVAVFISAKDAVEAVIQPLPWIGGPEADGAYYMCLLVFAVLVVAYTAWGGFRAVLTNEVVVPREAMGFGDVKFMAAIGAFLGWQATLFTLMASAMVGAVVGVLLMVTRKDNANIIPYGPYIALAAVGWVFGGYELWDWWWGRLSPAG